MQQLERINSQASGSCSCGQSCRCGQPALRRRRRSAEYGTLETIDEGSLNALRKEYKLGLKEITLSPDEDPAEALMRYNAASIREALERASQEPLEITGDQLAGGSEVQEQEQAQPEQEAQLEQAGEQQQQEYAMEANGKTLGAAPVEQLQQQEYLQQATVPAAPVNDTIVRELTAARDEFKQLYGLIQSLKNQLIRAEQSLTDCQFDATSSTTPASTTTTTSTSSTSTTTTTPVPTGSSPAPPATTPRSNAIQEEKSWERLLASKGYDTKYLTKSNAEQQQQQQLDTVRPESNVSGGDYSYHELQPYDPDNKAKRASGNGTTSTSTTEQPNVVVAVAKLLNSLAAEKSAAAESATAARTDEDLISEAGSTPTPYALRGKFVRRGVRTTRQAIRSSSSLVEPWNRSLSQEQVLLTKLDRLIDVLNDLLRLQLQRERSNSSSSSSNSIADSSSGGRRSISTSRMPSKVIRRLRRRKLRRSSTTTQAPQMRIHD